MNNFIETLPEDQINRLLETMIKGGPGSGPRRRVGGVSLGGGSNSSPKPSNSASVLSSLTAQSATNSLGLSSGHPAKIHSESAMNAASSGNSHEAARHHFEAANEHMNAGHSHSVVAAHLNAFTAHNDSLAGH